MQPVNSDFVFGQLRVAAVALIAYLSGRGIFTPADAGLATAMLTAFGPILAPWLASIYATYGTVKVGTSSVAAQVAETEKNISHFTNVTPEAAKAALVQTVKDATP